MRFAIEHGFDYLLNLDADFSHDPQYIPALLAGMADHDVMIGSRYVPGGGVEGGFTLKRRFMSTGHQHLRPAHARPQDPRQQRRLPLLPRQQAGRDRPRPDPVARLFLPGRDPLLVPGRSAAGSARRRSSSRTAARGSPRSICARPHRRSGSSSSSASRAGRGASPGSRRNSPPESPRKKWFKKNNRRARMGAPPLP